MKPFDRFIQKLRISKAAKYIPADSRLLDIGCADGAIFQQLSNKIREGVGIDPGIPTGSNGSNFQLVRGYFPEDMPPSQFDFDVVTLLAVLEHIPMEKQLLLAENIFRYLDSGGLLIISVPLSPHVDKILDVLKFLHLIDGMALEEHFGFDIKTVVDTFTKYGFDLIQHEYFQFGLNNLFVFKKP